MNEVVVVIPWREQPSRIYAYKKLLEWYSKYFPDILVISSDSDEKIFSPGKAKNLGSDKAISEGAKIIVFNDADVFQKPEQLSLAILTAKQNYEAVNPYSRVCEHKTTEQSELFFNEIFMTNHEQDLGEVFPAPKIAQNGLPNRLNPSGGTVVIPTNMFQELGRYEERLIGWGPEDLVLHKKYFNKYGKLFYSIPGALHSTYNDPSYRFKNTKNKKYEDFCISWKD
jgi:predicted glycosyltransferase involved in capsule biosynthesis